MNNEPCPVNLKLVRIIIVRGMTFEAGGHVAVRDEALHAPTLYRVSSS